MWTVFNCDKQKYSYLLHLIHWLRQTGSTSSEVWSSSESTRQNCRLWTIWGTKIRYWLLLVSDIDISHCYNPVVPAYPDWAYLMRIDDNTDAKRILLASTTADWTRQLGRPRITWLSTIQQNLEHHHLTLPEAADLAQNRPLLRMMLTYGATQS